MSQIYHSLMVLADQTADGFDLHLFASLLDRANLQAAETGLTVRQLDALLRRYFPLAVLPDQRPSMTETPEEQDLRDLLLGNATDPTSQAAHWLSAVIARRSQCDNHLWQDLGLPSRQDLSHAMRRHFAPLVALNDRDMKWKKFFYRQLCQMEGLTICKSPVCDACADFAICFGPED